MWTKKLKKLNCILALSSLIATQPSFADWMDKQMFSINPSIQLYGPIQGTVSSKEYKTKILRIILEEAHEKAREYLQVGDFEGYWGFIIAALTVPLHEGGNLHFRKVENDGKKCQDRSNSGSIFSSSTKYTNVFNRIFKNVSPVALPDCNVLNQQDFLYQLLHGHDGSDLGIMQVNLYWHERNYLAVGDWKSVRKTVRYGLQLVKNGYSGVYRNSNRYSCVQSSDGINFDNLIRASWSGIYNSGNLSSSCRFANPNSDWAQNDINFKNSLEKIKSLDESSNRSRYYSVNATEDQVLGQIVEHYKNKTQSAAILTNYLLNERVAGTDQIQPLLGAISDTPVVTDPVVNEPITPVIVPRPPVTNIARREFVPERVYEVTATSLNFRDGPGTQFNDCGNLPNKTEVIVKAVQGDWLELVEDESLAYYYEANNKCSNGVKFAHKNFLADKGPLYDETGDPDQDDVGADTAIIPTPSPSPVVVVTPTPDVSDQVQDQRKMGRAKGWAKVREDRPSGYTMAPATGQVIGPAGQELIIAEIVWNSSNSTHPWYRIDSPVKGWVYGQYVELVSEE